MNWSQMFYQRAWAAGRCLFVHVEPFSLKLPFNIDGQWYHFGIGAPSFLVYFSRDWDVHWKYGIFT